MVVDIYDTLVIICGVVYFFLKNMKFYNIGTLRLLRDGWLLSLSCIDITIYENTSKVYSKIEEG